MESIKMRKITGIIAISFLLTSSIVKGISPVKVKEESIAERILKKVKGKKHPYLYFEDIKKTPGWRLKNKEPYKWVGSIISYAKRFYLSKPSGGGDCLWYLGFSYQLTGDEKYAKAAVEGFKKMYFKGTPDRRMAWWVGKCATAYDFLAEYLEKNAPEVNKHVRYQLAKGADALYHYGLKDEYEAKYNFPTCGTVALVLADYKSPFKTGPVEWLKAGTEYLFCHPVTKRRIDGYFNEGGLYKIYNYHEYAISGYLTWFVILRRFEPQFFEEFPFARKVFVNPIIEMLPNGMNPTYIAAHGNKVYPAGFYGWYRGAISLPEPDKYWFSWFIKKFLGTPRDITLPIFAWVDLTNLPPGHPPKWTTFISPMTETAVFRENWEKTANYLFFRVINIPNDAYRCMFHHDNLNIEYYSKGDLLIHDSGEVKSYCGLKERLGEGSYGPVDSKGHNVLMINNGKGPVGGAVKSHKTFKKFDQPAYFTDYAKSGPVEFADAKMYWHTIEDRSEEPSPSNGWNWVQDGLFGRGKWKGKDYGPVIHLDNPVIWRRVVIFPHKEYFIILDNLVGNQERNIHALFHLTSLNFKPTVLSGKKSIGYVIGDLEVENKKVDWLKKQFGKEELICKNGRLITWTTTNIDKKKIKLYLFSTPSSKISVEKFWCAIGSTYPHYNEVDHPLIRYKIRASTMYRITVLYTILCDKENPPVFKDISTEKFSCVEIKNGNYTDYVASGKDISSSDFETDGLYTFFRTKDGKIKSLLIRNGTYLKWKGSKIVESTEKVSHLSLSFDGESIKGHIKTDNPVKITIRYDFSPSTATYKPVPDEWVWAWTEKLKKKYSSRSLKFKKDGGKIIIDCPSGRGEFMLEKKAG